MSLNCTGGHEDGSVIMRCTLISVFIYLELTLPAQTSPLVGNFYFADLHADCGRRMQAVDNGRRCAIRVCGQLLLARLEGKMDVL